MCLKSIWMQWHMPNAWRLLPHTCWVYKEWCERKKRKKKKSSLCARYAEAMRFIIRLSPVQYNLAIQIITSWNIDLHSSKNTLWFLVVRVILWSELFFFWSSKVTFKAILIKANKIKPKIWRIQFTTTQTKANKLFDFVKSDRFSRATIVFSAPSKRRENKQQLRMHAKGVGCNAHFSRKSDT